MKKFILLISFSLFLFSCKKVENFLDKAPGVDIDENTVFSTRQNAEQFVATLYQYGMPSVYGIRADLTGFGSNGLGVSGSPNGPNVNFVNITDESEASEAFAFTNDWNSGNIQPNNILSREDLRYFLRWQAIRVAHILLERIDEVPNADPTYKEQVKGEALFIRALSYFEMMKRYGGVPLVTKRIVSLEDAKVARSTLEEVVNQIVKDCDEAVAKLPVVQPSNFTGRAHKGAALALKARTLLYAASPLFNTATPYVSFGNAQDDKLVCYGNYDLNRWKLAADAAKAVLDWASTAGVELIDNPAKRIPVFTAGQRVDGNYRTAWEQNDNSEIILASKLYGAPKSVGQFPWQYLVPRNDHVPNSGGGWVGNSITFNFIRKYEKRDGTPQTWDMSGGEDLLQKYAELDPRFAQSVVYVGARLHANAPRVQIWEGAPSNKASSKGGHWLLKWVNDAITQSAQVPNDPIFRLNEVYLSYAEALNEFAGPSAEAYAAVNRIRTRSGMPDLPGALTQAQFRERVRNERAIEMAFEDQRLGDVRRWMIAEQDGVMSGQMWGLEIQRLNNTAPFPTAFSYKPYVFETRVFQRRQYLWPFDQNEVLKGNLKQNPGW